MLSEDELEVVRTVVLSASRGRGEGEKEGRRTVRVYQKASKGFVFEEMDAGRVENMLISLREYLQAA